MKISVLTLLVSILFACTPKIQNDGGGNVIPDGPYFGQSVGQSAEMFAEGIVSRSYQELNSVFSPDGNEFYFTIADPGRSFYTIMYYTKNEAGVWSGPAVAPFSGHYGDADPYITSDGNQLYFISKRPKGPMLGPSNDFDIWKVERTDGGWSEAIRLDSIINTPQNEFYVSATDDGSIFYSAQYDGGLGNGDIYQAIPSNGSYEIHNLGPAINTPTGEGDPYVSPDGQMIIFMSWGREDDMGRGDLYISFKKEGEWAPAKNLGAQINSTQFEYCPMVSPDGKYFFWTSYKSSPLESSAGYTYEEYLKRIDGPDNGMGNVYWIQADILEQFR